MSTQSSERAIELADGMRRERIHVMLAQGTRRPPLDRDVGYDIACEGNVTEFLVRPVLPRTNLFCRGFLFNIFGPAVGLKS